MPARTRPSGDSKDEEPFAESTVSVCRTRPGRYVFLEDGQSDAWIATDSVVKALR